MGPLSHYFYWLHAFNQKLLLWVIVMCWYKVQKGEYSSLHTPNICRRSGSRKRKGMLDTWRRFGVPLSSVSPTADPPPPPPEPTPDWPSIWDDPSDCWDREAGKRHRGDEERESLKVLCCGVGDDIHHELIYIISWSWCYCLHCGSCKPATNDYLNYLLMCWLFSKLCHLFV